MFVIKERQQRTASTGLVGSREGGRVQKKENKMRDKAVLYHRVDNVNGLPEMGGLKAGLMVGVEEFVIIDRGVGELVSSHNRHVFRKGVRRRQDGSSRLLGKGRIGGVGVWNHGVWKAGVC